MGVEFATTETANGNQGNIFIVRDQVMPGIQDQLVDHPGAGLDQLVYIVVCVKFFLQALIRLDQGALECPNKLLEGLLTGIGCSVNPDQGNPRQPPVWSNGRVNVFSFVFPKGQCPDP